MGGHLNPEIASLFVLIQVADHHIAARFRHILQPGRFDSR